MTQIDLYHGDCLEIMEKLSSQGVKVDAIICDPPYGTTQCKWDSVIPLDKMWSSINGLLKNNSPVILFGSEPFASMVRTSNINNFKYDWIWEKSKATNYLNAKKQPLRAHEYIMVFYDKPCKYHPQMVEGKPYDKGKALRETNVYGSQKAVLVKDELGIRYPRSVQYFTTAESEGKLHPTQKPLKLLEYLVKTYTDVDDTILDFTMGSGTTGLACKNLDRNFIGIEIDEHFYNIAKNRLFPENNA